MALKQTSVLCGALLLVAGAAQAADRVQPFIMASDGPGTMSDIVSQTKTKLTGAGFQIIGEYQPYTGADVIVITNDAMKKAATESKRGGYGAVDHVAVTRSAATCRSRTPIRPTGATPIA
jgi:hypothetical protein